MATTLATQIDAVNACEDLGDVVIMLRPNGSDFWKWFRLDRDDAVQLADQLRLLTHTTD